MGGSAINFTLPHKKKSNVLRFGDPWWPFNATFADNYSNVQTLHLGNFVPLERNEPELHLVMSFSKLPHIIPSYMQILNDFLQEFYVY